MSVVSLENYTPYPRFDSTPWIGVRFNESVSPEGPWTLVDTILFADPDTDPSQPKTRSFTTDNAVLDEGWYQIVWYDSIGNLVETTPVKFPPPPELEFAPGVDDIGDLLRARTKDNSGRELGTFSSTTRPTSEEVSRLISRASGIVAMMIGTDIPDILIPEAQTVVAWLTAMLVELTYYPEQVANDRSAYSRYKELYDEAIGTGADPGSLVLAVRNALTDQTVDVAGRPRAVGKFPAPTVLKW